LGIEIGAERCIIAWVMQCFGACETQDKDKNVLCRVEEIVYRKLVVKLM